MKNGLVIDQRGSKFWYLNDQLHREDGPAVETAWGYKYYYRYHKLHRVDGPAIEYTDGNKTFYLNGVCFSPEEHARLINLKMFW